MIRYENLPFDKKGSPKLEYKYKEAGGSDLCLALESEKRGRII